MSGFAIGRIGVDGFAMSMLRMVVMIRDFDRVVLMTRGLVVAERHAHACGDGRHPLQGDDERQRGYEDPGEPKKHWSIVSQ